MVYSQLGQGSVSLLGESGDRGGEMVARMKLILGGAVIVAALAWLGFVGFQESKAYYITVDEYSSIAGKLEGKTIKLAGDVAPGSVDRTKPQMEFVIGSRTQISEYAMWVRRSFPIHLRTDPKP
jgi:cytochrome c-type biogenesis protein CcmE